MFEFDLFSKKLKKGWYSQHARPKSEESSGSFFLIDQRIPILSPVLIFNRKPTQRTVIEIVIQKATTQCTARCDGTM